MMMVKSYGRNNCTEDRTKLLGSARVAGREDIELLPPKMLETRQSNNMLDGLRDIDSSQRTTLDF